MGYSSAPTSSASQPHSLKDIFSVVFGHILEYFDMMLYVHLMLVMVPLFLPCQDPFTANLAAVFTFASTYLVRPIGAAFFGYLGDKVGRVHALNVSLILMALGTGSIGLLPTYEQIGMYASIALLICRMLQGISSAGEPVGASIFLIESPAFSARKCFLSSMVNASAALGGVLAASLGFLCVKYYGESEGWRYPFLIGACIGLYGVYLRFQLRESGVFKQAKKRLEKAHHEFSLWEAMQRNYRQIFCVMGMSMLNPMGFFLTYVYGGDLLKEHTDLSTAYILGHNSLIMLVDACISLSTGLISERLGAKRVSSALSIGLCLLAYPMFSLFLSQPTYISITLWQVGILVLCSAYETPLRPLIVSLFPTVGRYSAYGIGWSVGRAIAYGLGTSMCVWLKKISGAVGPAYVMIVVGFVGFLALRAARPMYPATKETALES